MEGKKKSYRILDYSGLTKKHNSKRRHASSRQKGLVGSSRYCLKKVLGPQKNKSDFSSYTAKVKTP